MNDAFRWETLKLYVCLQLTAIATDKGVVPKKTTVQITITVYRNKFPPVFIKVPFEAAIQTTSTVGFPVLSVTATDEDTQVCLFHI